jgi:hypothetical protein
MFHASHGLPVGRDLEYRDQNTLTCLVWKTGNELILRRRIFYSLVRQARVKENCEDRCQRN